MARTAVITGASSGIGVAVAAKLAADGFNVMLGARREDRLKGLCSRLGSNSAYKVTDVSNPSDVAALVAKADEVFGQTDVLVNNAGIMPLSPPSAGALDDWSRMIDVNLRGVLHGIHAVLPQMIDRQDGHVVNVASVSGLEVVPASAVYSATKFGVRAVSDGLRQEMASNGVRVTVISPGGVTTELGNSITDVSVRASLRESINFDFLEPENIADAVAYALAQPPSVCIGEIVVRPTGQA